MRKWVIITGLLFVLGNATWDSLGSDKIYWIPLALHLWAMMIYVANNPKPTSYPMKCHLYLLSALATGHIIKEAFYEEGMKQVNDYVWGVGCVAVWLAALFKDWLLYKLKMVWSWATRNKHSGRK